MIDTHGQMNHYMLAGKGAAALGDVLADRADQDADEWLRSLPRKERRRLFRKHGLACGERRRGAGPRMFKGVCR